MILVSMWLLCSTVVSSVTAGAAAELDGLAFEAFGRRPKTGVAYEGAVPRNLTGIRVSAMRLKSGSLMTRGVERYGEFEIPKGVVTHPYVERLALLYYNLANWSLTYYPPIQGYTYLAPVLGLLAYEYEFQDDDDDLRLLSIHASALPIYIHFSHLLLPSTSTSRVVVPKCVFFDVNGSFNLSDMLPNNTCTTFQQGHFSVVVESVVAITPTSHRCSIKVWKIVGGVFGGFALLVIGVVGASKYKHRKKMHSMEMATELSEALYMTAVGTTKAPAAIGTRTHPKLETEYVP